MSGNFGRMDRALSIDEGDGSGLAKNVKCRRITPEFEFLGTALKFRKRKKSLSSCVYLRQNTSQKEISRSDRAVTIEKCTKKCAARKKMLFALLNLLLF